MIEVPGTNRHGHYRNSCNGGKHKKGEKTVCFLLG